MSRLLLALVLLTGASLGSAAYASSLPYVTAQDLDLKLYLPPPPANNSAQTKSELAEVLTLQVTRTPEMEARARADAIQDVWRFHEVMGPKFTKETLPRVSALFERVVATEEAVVDPAKEAWKRPRPHLLSDLVRPIARLSTSGSWPSGHATVGVLMGTLLSAMVPEKRPEIMNRAYEYGTNRVVAGIHFRSDVEVARIAGALIALELMRSPEFRAEFELAKAELRALSQ